MSQDSLTAAERGGQGIPARELSDEELERQGTYAHATRTWVLLHGTAEQYRHHTQRMLELEQEYLRRHPKRTWQGTVADREGAPPAPDPLTRLRLELRAVVNQIQALLDDPNVVLASGETSSPGKRGEVELLRRFAAADGGRLHKLEAHQAARELGMSSVDLAGLYRADPPLLQVDGDDRVLTAEGRRRLLAAGDDQAGEPG